ncbi:MAG: cytochrome c biogenesis CcdA family protein [Mycobacteriales bacterium]
MNGAAMPLLAVVAGLLSFSSPCALPLVPSYISYISGVPDGGGRRGLLLRASLAFVAGFTIVFTAMGASSTLIGSALVHHLPVILRVAGVVIIGMGLAALGLLRIPWLNRERRINLSRIPSGPKGALPLGMAFAFGWTPCIGPVLAAILAVASASRTVGYGAVLLALYSLGLGVPFVLIAVGFARAQRSMGWLRRHAVAVERTGGGLLLVVGVLFVTGVWRTLLVPLQVKFATLGWPPL